MTLNHLSEWKIKILLNYLHIKFTVVDHTIPTEYSDISWKNTILYASVKYIELNCIGIWR